MTGGNGVRDTATSAWYTTPAAPSGPPCQRGSRCGDHDDLPEYRRQHRDTCLMSPAMISRRQDRIDALTHREMRDTVVRLSGWTPTGTDWALAVVDEERRCPECETGPPGHTAQCTLKPGAPPVAVPVPIGVKS